MSDIFADVSLLDILVVIGILIGTVVVYKMIGTKFSCIILNSHVGGEWRPAPGGRDVKRCLYCGDITDTKDVTVTMAQRGTK